MKEKEVIEGIKIIIKAKHITLKDKWKLIKNCLKYLN